MSRDEPRQTIQPLSRMRSAIATTMTLSATVPQFTVESDVSFGACIDLLNGEWARENGISATDVVTAAVARTLTGHCDLNASFLGDAIAFHEDVNVGIAVAVEGGIVVPTIHGADRLALAAIAARRAALVTDARAGRLGADAVSGTTFTISSLAGFAVSRFRALVIPPQAAILAVGDWRRTGDMTLALSCDHRVCDGAPAAEFLRELRAVMEDPVGLFAGDIST